MRVLHVIPSVSPLRGGPSIAVRTMARGLTQAGVEVHVATTDDDGPGRLRVSYAAPIEEEGVTYWYFPRQGRFYTFSWPLSRWLARHVRDYDLVHIHALFSYAAVAAAVSASRSNVPYIVRPLGVLNQWGIRNRRRWLKRISFPLIERRILNGAAAVQFTSDQERIEAGELGVRQKAVVIPNAISTEAFSLSASAGRQRQNPPHLSGRTVIFFLSRLDPKKGLDLLLPAFARARAQYPRIALMLAGSGEADFMAHLQKEAVRLGIASDLFWVGFLAGEQKWAALAEADIFVLPSYSENFGIAAAESMVFGLPVVVSDQVAIHREIAEAQAGLVVPCDVEALTKALLVLVGDAALRHRLGANGRSLARTQFSPGAVTDQLIRLYTAVGKPALSEAVA